MRTQCYKGKERVNKVKEIKENKSKEDKEQENANKLASRAKLFEKSLIPFLGTYTKEMLRDFADYWTEPNRSGENKMAFELKKQHGILQKD